jgi:adhesin/invasin
VTVSNATIVASAGSSSATITVTARDANGNAIQGATVELAATGTGKTVTPLAAVTSSAGSMTGTLSATVAGSKTISATINVSW